MTPKYRIIPIGGGGMDPSTKYGASISMSMDQDYILSVQLLDQDGNALGNEQTVDLPLESVVVNGSYDSSTQSLILTLDNGNTITIPISGLISGLQAEITAQNPLSADLVTNGTNNKVFTAADKTKLDNITVNDATITVHQDGQTDQTFTLNQSGDQTINIAAGGGNSWYGTQAQFDALGTYDEDTDYFISDKIDYSEISNTPIVPTKVSQLQNDVGYALRWKVANDIDSAIKQYDSKTKWVTQAEYAAMELAGTLEEGVAYHIEGPQTAVQMVVTFTDQSTATYDVYVGSIS